MQLKRDVVTLTLNPALDVATSVAKVEPVHKLRCGAPRFDPGGGGINVARVVHRLGGSALCVYPAGGSTGERLTSLLEAEGAPAAPVAIAGETRESFNVTDRADGSEYRFVLPGPQLSARELERCLEDAVAAAHRGGFLVASGSLPPGAPPGTLGDLAKRARAGGLRLVVDTSGPALAAALTGGVHLVKPNLRELSDHLGAPLPDAASRLQACRDLIASGAAEIVALSLGAEGALLVSAQEAWTVAAVAIRPASTVGAGDSFLAGLVWALSQDMGLADALRHGAAAGAATLLSPGTELCRRDEVLALAARISPARLS